MKRLRKDAAPHGNSSYVMRPIVPATLVARADEVHPTNDFRDCANIVAKVCLGWRTKNLKAADASYARPCGFIQNQSRAFAVTLKGDEAAEMSKNRP